MSSSAIESLSGLGHAKRAVQRVLSSASGVHAVMFYGQEGAGKRTLARYLAKSWMCPTPVEGLACEDCAVCRSMDTGRAVDFMTWAPWGPQSLIKLSSLKETTGWRDDKDRPELPFVMDFFRTRPLMARSKVVLFESADRMNSDTANALLKTLEEPGDSAKILLTTNEFSRVLPTIRSRCMCVACELPEGGGASAAGGDPVESVFGRTPGGAAHVREHREVFQRLYDLLESTRGAEWGSALRFAEEANAVSTEYERSAKLKSRAADVRVVEAIASWAAVRMADRPDALKAVAQAHRRVLGNAQAQIAFEDLFLSLLYHG